MSNTNETQPIVRKVVTRAKLDKIATTGSDIKLEYVHVPEWATDGDDPAEVYACVRGLTGSERDQYEGSIVVFKGKNRSVNMENARAKLVVKCLIDPSTMQRLYNDSDTVQLGKRSAAVIDRLWDTIRTLSGITEADQEELQENLKNA